jgi:DNA-binding transcriptional LysR family regulator
MELVAEDLAAFAAFAQHRNFTRAAAELHVSQPLCTPASASWKAASVSGST